MTELSEFDLTLITELQADGRVPFTVLAERLGVSEASVRRRVKALVESNVVSVTAVTNPRYLGLNCRAWLGLWVRYRDASRVADTLATLPEVKSAALTTGRFNVMAWVGCPSTADLYRFLRGVRRLPGVERSETAIYLTVVRQQFQWLLAGEAEGFPAVGTGDDNAGLDATDTALIRVLREDGRAPFREIGRQLGLSERVVSDRFRKLTQANLLQVIGIADPEHLGLKTSAWLAIRVAAGVDIADVARPLAEVRNIDYLTVTSGEYDLMAEIVCRDNDDFRRVLQNDVGAVEGIERIESSFYLRLLYEDPAAAWGPGHLLPEMSRH